MKSFFIHLSMTLKYTLNPKYWFMTDTYKLRKDNRPQDIKKSDIKSMINELEERGHIDHAKAVNLFSVLEEMSEMDLKRVYVRSLESDEVKEDFKDYLDHQDMSLEEEEKSINNAINEFLGRFSDELIQ